jgi:16S rRNA (guanine966-N2)-methyltransferase
MMDRVREALFNILAHRDWGVTIGDPLEGTHVLDAFCGTGALAFEAISWGAAHATLFDKDRSALQIATRNAVSLDIVKCCVIIEIDALVPPRAPKPCRLVFLAPPYRKALIPPTMHALNKAGWIAPNALIIAETAKEEEVKLLEGFTLLLSRFYGGTAVHFVGQLHSPIV